MGASAEADGLRANHVNLQDSHTLFSQPFSPKVLHPEFEPRSWSRFGSCWGLEVKSGEPQMSLCFKTLRMSPIT